MHGPSARTDLHIRTPKHARPKSLCARVVATTQCGSLVAKPVGTSTRALVLPLSGPMCHYLAVVPVRPV